VQGSTVPVTTLDSLVKGSNLIGLHLLIKVDVEGAEMGVLKGAGETLAAFRAPTWMVEINLNEHHPAGQIPTSKRRSRCSGVTATVQLLSTPTGP
jgi:hypothetical protein